MYKQGSGRRVDVETPVRCSAWCGAGWRERACSTLNFNPYPRGREVGVRARTGWRLKSRRRDRLPYSSRVLVRPTDTFFRGEKDRR